MIGQETIDDAITELVRGKTLLTFADENDLEASELTQCVSRSIGQRQLRRMSTKAQSTDERFPSLFKQVQNAAKAAGRVIKNIATGKPVYATSAVAQKRREACQKCDKRKGSRCLECACFIQKKTSLATEICPIGGWQ